MIDLPFVDGRRGFGERRRGDDGARASASRGFTYGRGGPWAFATRARGADWPPRVRSLPRDRLSTFAGRKRNNLGTGIDRGLPTARRAPAGVTLAAVSSPGLSSAERSPRTDQDCATLHAPRAPVNTAAASHSTPRARIASSIDPRPRPRTTRAPSVAESRPPTRALANNRRRPRETTRDRSCPPRERSRRPSPTCTLRWGCRRRPPAPRSAAPTATSSPRCVDTRPNSPGAPGFHSPTADRSLFPPKTPARPGAPG